MRRSDFRLYAENLKQKNYMNEQKLVEREDDSKNDVWKEIEEQKNGLEKLTDQIGTTANPKEDEGENMQQQKNRLDQKG